jgi:hypothetical protein
MKFDKDFSKKLFQIIALSNKVISYSSPLPVIAPAEMSVGTSLGRSRVP